MGSDSGVASSIAVPCRAFIAVDKETNRGGLVIAFASATVARVN